PHMLHRTKCVWAILSRSANITWPCRCSTTNWCSAASPSHADRTQTAVCEFAPAVHSRAGPVYAVTGPGYTTYTAGTCPDRASALTEVRSTGPGIAAQGLVDAL